MAHNLSLKNQEMFLDWLDMELAKRGWTDYKLTQTADLAHSVMYKARKLERPIKWEACIKIARALNLPPAEVLIQAGLLPEDSERDALIEQIVYKLKNASPKIKREILRYTEYILEKDKTML